MTGGDSGQATVETVGMIPLVAITCAVLAQAILMAGFALHADRAAHAASLADSQGRSPTLAARKSIPDWARGKVSVHRSTRFLRVTLRPKSLIPGLDGLVATNAKFERQQW